MFSILLYLRDERTVKSHYSYTLELLLVVNGFVDLPRVSIVIERFIKISFYKVYVLIIFTVTDGFSDTLGLIYTVTVFLQKRSI